MSKNFPGALLASATLALSFATLSQAATTISGTPGTQATVNQSYTFHPKASDTDSRPIYWSIQNRPWWAGFNTTTGELAGTPNSYALGTFTNIVITASDGVSSKALPAFNIKVVAAGSSGSGGTGGGSTTVGAATLSWTPPTQNSDGSTLTNLAGYTIKYGTSSGALNTSIKLSNPGLTTYVVDNLTAGTYYFTVFAYTSSGTTSSPSSLVSKTIK